MRAAEEQTSESGFEAMEPEPSRCFLPGILEAESGRGGGWDASVITRPAAPPLLRPCAYYRFH